MLHLTPSQYGFYFGIISHRLHARQLPVGTFRQGDRDQPHDAVGKYRRRLRHGAGDRAVRRRALPSAVAVRPGLLHRHRQRHHAAQRQCRHGQRQAASGGFGLRARRRHADRRRRGAVGACRRAADAAVRPLPAALGHAAFVGGGGRLDALRDPCRAPRGTGRDGRGRHRRRRAGGRPRDEARRRRQAAAAARRQADAGAHPGAADTAGRAGRDQRQWRSGAVCGIRPAGACRRWAEQAGPLAGILSGLAWAKPRQAAKKC